MLARVELAGASVELPRRWLAADFLETFCHLYVGRLGPSLLTTLTLTVFIISLNQLLTGKEK
jgi:hypothetical protein